MNMRFRLYDVNGTVLEDHEIELSEDTKQVLANNRDPRAAPQVTVEFIWEPQTVISAAVAPRSQQ